MRRNHIILLSLFYLYIKIYSKQGWTFYITNVKDEQEWKQELNLTCYEINIILTEICFVEKWLLKDTFRQK
jgi:hypothetical protein